MSATLVSLLFAVGAGAWIYNRLMRTTGSNIQSSLVATAVAGIIIFIVAYILLSALFE